MSTYAWTVYATQTAIVLAVMGLLGTALFQLLGRIDRLGERMDARFERIDQHFDGLDARLRSTETAVHDHDRQFISVGERFDRVEATMRQNQAEILDRIDGLIERVNRLEARGGSAA